MPPAIASITSVNEVRAIDLRIDLLQRLDARQRQIGIHRPDGLPDLIQEALPTPSRLLRTA